MSFDSLFTILNSSKDICKNIYGLDESNLYKFETTFHLDGMTIVRVWFQDFDHCLDPIGDTKQIEIFFDAHDRLLQHSCKTITAKD